MKFTYLLGAVIGAALAIPFAFASGLTSPTGASIGSTHTIDVTGETLAKKPKVVLTYAGPIVTAKGDPKAKASVTSVEGDTLTFVVKKAKGSGQFDVSIKGSESDFGSITVFPPDLETVNVEEAAPGDTVVLGGQWFGAKKPKVTINGKKQKVTANDDTSITVLIHKKTPGGAGDIVVTAKTGSSTLSGQLQINVPPKPVKGKDIVSAKFGNIKLVAKAGKTGHVVQGLEGPLDSTTLFGQSTSVGIGGANIRNIQITFLSSFATPVPGTWTGADVSVVLNDTKAGLSGGTTRSYVHSGDTLGEGSSFQISVDSVSGNRISGSFSGTLVAGDNTPAGTVKGAGKFTATLNGGP